MPRGSDSDLGQHTRREQILAYLSASEGPSVSTTPGGPCDASSDRVLSAAVLRKAFEAAALTASYEDDGGDSASSGDVGRAWRSGASGRWPSGLSGISLVSSHQERSRSSHPSGAWEGGSQRFHTERTDVLYAHHRSVEERKLMRKEELEREAGTFVPTLASTTRTAESARSVHPGTAFERLAADAQRKAREQAAAVVAGIEAKHRAAEEARIREEWVVYESRFRRRDKEPDEDRLEALYAMGVDRHSRAMHQARTTDDGEEFDEPLGPPCAGHGGHGPGGSHGYRLQSGRGSGAGDAYGQELSPSRQFRAKPLPSRLYAHAQRRASPGDGSAGGADDEWGDTGYFDASGEGHSAHGVGEGSRYHDAPGTRFERLYDDARRIAASKLAKQREEAGKLPFSPSLATRNAPWTGGVVVEDSFDEALAGLSGAEQAFAEGLLHGGAQPARRRKSIIEATAERVAKQQETLFYGIDRPDDTGEGDFPFKPDLEASKSTRIGREANHRAAAVQRAKPLYPHPFDIAEKERARREAKARAEVPAECTFKPAITSTGKKSSGLPASAEPFLRGGAPSRTASGGTSGGTSVSSGAAVEGPVGPTYSNAHLRPSYRPPGADGSLSAEADATGATACSGEEDSASLDPRLKAMYSPQPDGAADAPATQPGEEVGDDGSSGRDVSDSDSSGDSDGKGRAGASASAHSLAPSSAPSSAASGVPGFERLYRAAASYAEKAAKRKAAADAAAVEACTFSPLLATKGKAGAQASAERRAEKGPHSACKQDAQPAPLIDGSSERMADENAAPGNASGSSTGSASGNDGSPLHDRLAAVKAKRRGMDATHHATVGAAAATAGEAVDASAGAAEFGDDEEYTDDDGEGGDGHVEDVYGDEARGGDAYDGTRDTREDYMYAEERVSESVCTASTGRITPMASDDENNGPGNGDSDGDGEGHGGAEARGAARGDSGFLDRVAADLRRREERAVGRAKAAARRFSHTPDITPGTSKKALDKVRVYLCEHRAPALLLRGAWQAHCCELCTLFTLWAFTRRLRPSSKRARAPSR